MSRQKLLLWLAGVAIASAQTAVPPTSYSVTLVNGMMGVPVTMKIYRDGQKAVIDNIHDGQTSRSLYDLQAHTNISWDATGAIEGCSSGQFSGDWGDPFSSADVDALLKGATKPPGHETVNGIATETMEATDAKSGMKIKVWREPKTGLIVKADMTPPGGAAATTIIETKSFTPGKPDARLFTVPAACAKLVNAAPVPTAAERYAAETGGTREDFVEASTGPGSPNSCSMLLRVVKAGSMEPLTNFQIALDLDVNLDHPASYTMGGTSRFAGGHLKEYTTQLQNGTLRIDNVPPQFDIEMLFGNAGAGSAVIYRKCSSPQTVLLFVVKNPAKMSDGADWMWVKSGKFATAR